MAPTAIASDRQRNGGGHRHRLEWTHTPCPQLDGEGQPEKQHLQGQGEGEDPPLALAQRGTDADKETVDNQIDGDGDEQRNRHTGALGSFGAPGKPVDRQQQRDAPDEAGDERPEGMLVAQIGQDLPGHGCKDDTGGEVLHRARHFGSGTPHGGNAGTDHRGGDREGDQTGCGRDPAHRPIPRATIVPAFERSVIAARRTRSHVLCLLDRNETCNNRDAGDTDRVQCACRASVDLMSDREDGRNATGDQEVEVPVHLGPGTRGVAMQQSAYLERDCQRDKDPQVRPRVGPGVGDRPGRQGEHRQCDGEHPRDLSVRCYWR